MTLLLHLIEFFVLISDIQGLYGLLLTDDLIYNKNLAIYKKLIIITLKKRQNLQIGYIRINFSVDKNKMQVVL